jgi:uncharacterized membrane protein YgcG
MRTYADDQERIIRVRRLADEWMRSGLIDAAQHERIAAGLHVDLRRTNRFLRLTLLGFGLLIIAAAVGLAVVTINVNDVATAGMLCLIAAAASAAVAEFLIRRFRLYRFGVEEACAVAAAVLVGSGSGLMARSLSGATYGEPQMFVALVAGSAAALAVYSRYGYVYAAVGAMLCASLAPFPLQLSDVVQRLLATAVLGGCFIGARMKRRRYGDEFPGDEHGTIQAAAWLGMYAALNIQLFSALFPRPLASWFHWFTYAMIWTLPAAGLWLSIRDRDRPLLDASLVMVLATLFTNKPYLGAARKPWDPILLGLLLIGTAIVLRRWLASGSDGSRRGFTATRLSRSDKDTLASVGIASAAFHQGPSHRHSDPSSPDPFKGDGGRSGGAGGGGSF